MLARMPFVGRPAELVRVALMPNGITPCLPQSRYGLGCTPQKKLSPPKLHGVLCNLLFGIRGAQCFPLKWMLAVRVRVGKANGKCAFAKLWLRNALARNSECSTAIAPHVYGCLPCRRRESAVASQMTLPSRQHRLGISHIKRFHGAVNAFFFLD